MDPENFGYWLLFKTVDEAIVSSIYHSVGIRKSPDPNLSSSIILPGSGDMCAVYPRVFENFQKCHVWVIFNINFLSSNEVLDIQDKVQFFLKKNFRSGLVNTLSAGPFFWKSRIFRNFFRFSKCSNSVNFEGRRNLNPFLESFKALLSNAHAWRGVPLTKKCKTNLT